MPLNQSDIETVLQNLMAGATSRRENWSITKPDARTIIANVDQWVADNKASFNTALSPEGDGLNNTQKSRILHRVLERLLR